MNRTHGTMHNRFRIEAAIDGQHSHAVLIPPHQPTRRRSPDLSAYDRLDPPNPRRYGKGRMADLEGMDRLRAALDKMSAKMNAAAAVEAMRVSAEDVMRRARGGAGARAESGQPYSMAGVRIVVDEAVGPDRAVMGFRWPDGSIRPYAHKRSDTFW